MVMTVISTQPGTSRCSSHRRIHHICAPFLRRPRASIQFRCVTDLRLIYSESAIAPRGRSASEWSVAQCRRCGVMTPRRIREAAEFDNPV